MQRSNYPSQAGASFWGNLGNLLESSAASIFSLLLIPALLAVALLLPPVSLLDRIQALTLTTVNTNGATLFDPDGTAVTFPGEFVTSSFRAGLDSLPRADFMATSAGGEWGAALANLPDSLNPRSPLYQLDLRGETPNGAIFTIPIPNDSQPYETLEIYTWTGERWQHLPSRLLMPTDQIESEIIGELPGNFMVMQTAAPVPSVSANIGSTPQIPANAENAVTQMVVGGLYLRGDGALDGQLQPVALGNYQIVPVLRNWQHGEMPRIDLLNNMIIDPGLQFNQINAVTDLLVANGFPGVVIDYRGVDATPLARADFTNFIQALAERLHSPDVNRSLSVRVEAPRQISAEEWDTLGYDWRAISLAADKVIVPAPVDPRAYARSGEMDALLNFATSQIDRAKLQIELPGRSVERSGTYLLLKGYQESLNPLIAEIGITGEIAPGQPIQLSVNNERLLNRLSFDPAIGTYSYSYIDDQGFERTVYVENADSFTHKLGLLSRYNVTNVVVRDLEGGDVDPQIWEIARQFQQGTLTQGQSGGLAVAYSLFNADGALLSQEIRPLDNPGYAFMAPADTTQVQVQAELVNNNQRVGASNRVALALATPTPVPPTPTPTPEFARLSSGQVVNVRGGPSTQYPVLGQIQPGQTYQVTGRNEGQDWWQFDFNGQSGWVINSLVNVDGNMGTVAVITDIPAPPAPQVAEAPAPAEQRAEAAPAPAPAAVSAPAPTGGGSFGYGLQAHMIHVGADEINRVFNATRDLGFGWLKQQIEWHVFESTQGNIGWSDMDDLVNRGNSMGINLLFSVVNAPDWAREPGFDGSVGGPPQDPQTFANFLGAMAGRFCGTSLKAIEVWNEQNLHYEWGNRPLNAAEYVRLLAPSYAAIKAACPSMYVISGALTPAGNNGNLAIDDAVYLEQMFQAGLNNYMDGIGAHPSGYNVPPWATWQDACGAIQQTGNSFNGPCDSPHHSWSFRSTMERYREIAVAYGAANKRIWPTEFGWAAGGAFDPRYAYANDNSFEEQAAWTVEAYQMMKNWGWVGPAILWNLNFRVIADGTEKAQWGIVTNGWGPLPIYTALRDMPK